MTARRVATSFVWLAVVGLRAVPVHAQPALGPSAQLSVDATAAAPPTPPAVVSREPSGRVSLRAVRIDRPLTIDGRLDESIYETSPPIGDFVQQVPNEGAPTTEKTEAWILFDGANFYFSARCYDREPDRIIANELRHDSVNIFNGNDSITLVLDTMLDRRNGFLFQTNPLGALREQAIADGSYIESWSAIWQVRSTRFDGGWTTEMQIPFKSLRYRDNGPQVWGINVRRVIRRKNEFAGVTPMPAAFGSSGLAQMQVAATLYGLVTPTRTRNLELKPYAVSSNITDNTARNPFQNRLTGNVGGDLKYGLSRSLMADVTVNTDFAQIEEDVQQVNLTRFNLLFPEKRDFFLEGQGIYAFGGRSILGRGAGDTDDVPIMFFSRQVGLANGQALPVRAGGRVTGKAGRYDIAALNIQTGEKTLTTQTGESVFVPGTNVTAVRIRRDIFRRSNIGAIVTSREPNGDGLGSALFGADASFRVSQNTTVLGYLAASDKPGTREKATSYRGRFDYAGDRFGVVAEHVLVGSGFEPAVGYIRRRDFRRDFLAARFSPRLRRHRTIRRFIWEAAATYYTNAAVTRVENRAFDVAFATEFHNSDQTGFALTKEYELLPQDFRIAPDVTVENGGYQQRSLFAFYNLGNQRRVAGRLSTTIGRLYDGTRREASYSGRIAVRPRFTIEPGLSLAWVNLPVGEFAARLMTSRFTWTPTNRMFVSSLLQYNIDAHTTSSSVRWRWEYRLGSELFVVYSDGRDTLASPRTVTGSPIMNRTVAVKATRLLRF